MADDQVVAKIVTEFFLNTCRLRRRFDYDDLMALTDSAWKIYLNKASGHGTDIIPLLTGSAAELYIDPMLSCVGDVDIMIQFGRL